MKKKIVVLHSGGLDSTTCLYLAQSQGHQVVSLGVNYGQRLWVEMLFAEKQCRDRGIERQTIAVRWAKTDRPIPLDRNVDEIRRTPSEAFLAGRNVVFLALASAHAVGIGADEVWLGINSIDYSGYPDCTPQFLDAFSKLQDVANPIGPKIFAPLIEKSKPEIASLARSLGITRADTWSCYRPDLSAGTIKPCGRCDACKLHEFAWTHSEAMAHG